MGFIKFLKGYYVIFITDKKRVAMIARHKIYKVKDIKLIPLFRTINNDKSTELENKYVQTFKEIQISKGFYFSYTYDISHSLQHNILR
jgi:phosphatidylinositol 3,5-bisphosphate 5-phosphatase